MIKLRTKSIPQAKVRVGLNTREYNAMNPLQTFESIKMLMNVNMLVWYMRLTWMVCKWILIQNSDKKNGGQILGYGTWSIWSLDGLP